MKKPVTAKPVPEDTPPKTILVTMDAEVIKAIWSDLYIKHACGGIAGLSEVAIFKIIQAMRKGDVSIHLFLPESKPAEKPAEKPKKKGKRHK